MGIYIIRAKNGPVKIGFTDSDPHKRISNLSTSHWAELELLAFMDGDKKTEKALHRRFSAARIRGEWFDVTPEVEAFIKSCPKPERRKTRKFTDSAADHLEALRSIWFDKTIPSNNEAGRRAGVSYQLLRRHFGPSGRERQVPSDVLRDGQKKSVAIRTAGRKVDRDGLYDLWGSDLTLQQIIEQSGWKQSSIYHAMKGVSREDAKANVQARLRRTRKVRTK